jgi:hypothetical protein
MVGRRKLRPRIWPVSRNAIIACAGLCGVALTPHLAFAQASSSSLTTTADKDISIDSEVLVAMNAERYRLADDITAAPLNGSLCVDVQQMFSALDFPILVDRSRQIASGWFINESRNFSLDLRTGAAEVGDSKSTISRDALGNLSSGRCITIDALAKLMALTIDYDGASSALSIASVQRLPILTRLDRQSREKATSLSLGNGGVLPRLQSLPYRAFVAPNTDVSITFGRHQAPGMKKSFDATWSILSVGELAYMTAEAQIAGTEDGLKRDLSRFRLYRTEREGGVFGFAKLTEFSLGDISGAGSSLGSTGGVGLGISASTFPLGRATSFSTTNFEGALPAGWDVELYRNGQLLEFSNDANTGGYSFRDVPVLFGDNNFEIVQYGPQGQRRVVTQRINASNFLAPKGEQYYRAAIYRPEVLFGNVKSGSGVRIDLRSAIGLANNLNLGLGFDSYMLGAQRLSIGTIAALTSVSGIALNSELSMTSDGKLAGLLEFQGAGKGASFRGRLILAQEGFETERLARNIKLRFETSADRAFRVSERASGTISGRFTYDRLANNESSFTARQRMTLSYGNAWIAQSLMWSRSSSGERRDDINGDMAISLRRGLTSFRASVEYDAYPKAEISRVSAAVERSLVVGQSPWRWRAESSWDLKERRFIHTASIGREFGLLNFDIIAESDGRNNHRLGVGLSFSLGRRNNGWGMTSQPLASSGTVRARLFEDMDDNGTFSSGDVPLPKAGVIANTGRRTSTTDASGFAILEGLSSGLATQVNVLSDDLEDPNLYARATYTKPREGTVSEISIPLTKMGSIEGTVDMISGFDPTANPLGGITLVLLNPALTEVARTTSAYDGYYSFDLVPVGTYTVAIAPDTSLAKRLRPVVPLEVTTTRQEPGSQGRLITLIETNPTSTKMALRGLI